MVTEDAKRKLALPGEKEWAGINVKGFKVKLSDGAYVSVPTYTMQVASHYPTYEDGSPVASKTQAQVAKFLKGYPKFRYPMLFEDEAMRDQLGQNHEMFDENFERNGKPWRWGYVADFTRPCGKEEKGVNGQPLVTRILGYRLPGGDVEVGLIRIAPNGMVPTLSREKLEKMIKKEGLKALEKRRGREIYEKGNEIVDVRNTLGYPQFTLDHNALDDRGNIIPHSYHVYTPSQESEETVGGRDADWDHHDGHGCFDVGLRVGPGDSYSGGSFPLVRGGGVEAEIVRPNGKNYKIAI